MTQQATYGVWTPWAQILCYKCHGNEFPVTFQNDEGKYVSEMRKKYNEVDWANKLLKHSIASGNKVTFCDRCECDVQLDESIAEEHNMVKALRALNMNAHMSQTGGMNSACELFKKTDEVIDVETEYHPFYYVTYNFDGDNKYWISGYDKNDEWIEDETFGFDTFEEMLTHIKTLTNVDMQRMFKVTSPDSDTVLMNEDAIYKQAAYYYNNSDITEGINLRNTDECIELIKRVDTVEEVK